MNSQIYLIVLVLALITVIPASSAQLSLGAEANQKLIEVNLNKSEIINVKHVIAASNMPVSVNLFDGVIPESITVTNDNGDEKQFGLADNGQRNASITIFPTKSNTIIKYDYFGEWDLEDQIEHCEMNDYIFNKYGELVGHLEEVHG